MWLYLYTQTGQKNLSSNHLRADLKWSNNPKLQLTNKARNEDRTAYLRFQVFIFLLQNGAPLPQIVDLLLQRADLCGSQAHCAHALLHESGTSQSKDLRPLLKRPYLGSRTVYNSMLDPVYKRILQWVAGSLLMLIQGHQNLKRIIKP